MNVNGSVPWKWRADPSPPEPCGAVAWHEAARRLHARLAQLPAPVQTRLFVSVSRDVLVVTGNPADLPWVPGIAYATRSADAPALWRPTVLQPDVPADLLARALRRFHARGPLLLWPDPTAVIPLDRQFRVSAELLARIEQRWQAA